MIKCGLLGERISNSFSPALHALLGAYPYGLFIKNPDEIEDFLKNGDWTGINVTMPYKKAVIPYLDYLDITAKETSSVNVIIKKNGVLSGYNTDAYGFEQLLDKNGFETNGKKVLVLGSGGASATVSNVLSKRGAEVTIVSRTGKNNYENIDHSADAIVNTTPVGMYPDVSSTPVNVYDFKRLSWVIDIVYNPVKTKLVISAEKAGVPAAGGLYMLVVQGIKAAELFTWNPVKADADCICTKLTEMMG